MKIALMAALTADGFIGRSSDHLATTWTSKEDKRHFVQISKELHCIVMGLNTYKTIGRGLPGRRTLVYSPEPVGDSSIEVVSEPPADLIKRLEKEGEKSLLICGGATIYSMFMQAGVVTDLYLTIEPKLFGTGLSLFKDQLDKNLTLLKAEPAGNSVMLHFSIQ